LAAADHALQRIIDAREWPDADNAEIASAIAEAPH
jgi:hypothetical protein